MRHLEALLFEDAAARRGVGAPAPGAGLVARAHRPRRARVAGRSLGGTLTLLAHLAGTPFAPPLDGAILLLEDVGEKPYRIDRCLTQLRLAGALDGVAGVAVGRFTRLRRRRACSRPTSVREAVLAARRPGDRGVPGRPRGRELRGPARRARDARRAGARGGGPAAAPLRRVDGASAGGGVTAVLARASTRSSRRGGATASRRRSSAAVLRGGAVVHASCARRRCRAPGAAAARAGRPLRRRVAHEGDGDDDARRAARRRTARSRSTRRSRRGSPAFEAGGKERGHRSATSSRTRAACRAGGRTSSAPRPTRRRRGVPACRRSGRRSPRSAAPSRAARRSSAPPCSRSRSRRRRARAPSTAIRGSSRSGSSSRRCSGEPLAALADERVFRPLGLADLLPRRARAGATRAARAAGRAFVPTEACEHRREVNQGAVNDDNAWAMGGGRGARRRLLDRRATWPRSARRGSTRSRGRGARSCRRRSRRSSRAATRRPGTTRALGWDTPSREGSSLGTRLGRGRRGAIGHLGFTGTSLWIDLDARGRRARCSRTASTRRAENERDPRVPPAVPRRGGGGAGSGRPATGVAGRGRRGTRDRLVEGEADPPHRRRRHGHGLVRRDAEGGRATR